MRKTAHVAGTLHIILAAQGVHAHAAPSDIACRHCKVGNRNHGRTALTMFCNAKAVIDRAIGFGGEKAGSLTDVGGGNLRDCFECFRRISFLADKLCPVAELIPIATFADKGFVDKALGHDHMRHRG